MKRLVLALVMLLTLSCASSSGGRDAPPPISRVDASVRDVEITDRGLVHDVLAVSDTVDASNDVPIVPRTSGDPDRRLHVFSGGTVVLTIDKVFYGWGQRMSYALGMTTGELIARPMRLDLDERTYRYLFGRNGGCRNARGGLREVQCWTSESHHGFPVGGTPRDPLPIPTPMYVGVSVVAPFIGVQREDGIWRWPPVDERNVPVNSTEAVRTYTGVACGYLPSNNGIAPVWCVYDCARRGLACAGYWYNIGIDGEISFDSGHRDHVYFLPVDGASMIASDGHMTFYAVRPDGSLWCRGQCGGQQVATPGPPHEGFRRVEGLPPLTYIESNVAPQTTCAITREGTVQCWGRCSLVLGRRCNAGAAALYAPETLPGPEGVIELAMTDTHACALTASDEVWCWGRAYGFPDDSEGEVYTSWVPQRIALPVRDR